MNGKMTRHILLLALVLATSLFSSRVFAGSVVGSKHDLSVLGEPGAVHAGNQFDDYNEVCVYCHTPHGADPAVPLWNRGEFGGNYTLYNSQTLDASMEQPALGGVTRMCLSCHDGTIAVDNIGNVPNTSFTSAPEHDRMSTENSPDSCGRCHSGDAVALSFVGTDLSDDHPVSFVYDDSLAVADGGLEPPSTAPSGLGGTIAQDMLISGKVECSSCHNVHNPDNVPFLVRPKQASVLCYTCHLK